MCSILWSLVCFCCWFAWYRWLLATVQVFICIFSIIWVTFHTYPASQLVLTYPWRERQMEHLPEVLYSLVLYGWVSGECILRINNLVSQKYLCKNYFLLNLYTEKNKLRKNCFTPQKALVHTQTSLISKIYLGYQWSLFLMAFLTGFLHYFKYTLL